MRGHSRGVKAGGGQLAERRSAIIRQQATRLSGSKARGQNRAEQEQEQEQKAGRGRRDTKEESGSEGQQQAEKFSSAQKGSEDGRAAWFELFSAWLRMGADGR